MMRRQLLAATTLATLAGAFAVVSPLSRRGLFQHSGLQEAGVKTVQSALEFAAALRKAHVVDAKGGNHLYFYALDGQGSPNPRCGEVDAAPYMPAAIFETRNLLSLAAYAKATVELYTTPTGFGIGPFPNGRPVFLGQCKDVISTNPRRPGPYSACGGRVGGISWFRGMNDVCVERCQCCLRTKYCVPNSIYGERCTEGCPASSTLPRCTDERDDPSAGRFCSLCGPSTRCPGCASGTVKITLCGPRAPPPPPTTIVDVAVATADLSTLVAALKAGDLVSTLSGAGPFTVFAPTNEAFAALPMGVLGDLLKPENKARLDKVLTYHVVAGKVLAATLIDGQRIKTVEGEFLTVRISGSDVFINSAKVITADVKASNGVIHIIDGVLTPPSADDASADQVVAGKGGKGGVCSDDASFRDTYGTCATYVDNKWCAYGTTGPAWQQAWGALGAAAAKACCACGGGNIAH